jgi:hypothetical protein
MTNKKWASGTAVSANSSGWLTTANASGSYPFTVTGLDFEPSIILAKVRGTENVGGSVTYVKGFDETTRYAGIQEITIINGSNAQSTAINENFYVRYGEFQLPYASFDTELTWWAFE